ncbi:MAG: TRAP transporter substrate-binding protein DctP [Burkholderiaceae bacterium]|nr:TRAP transporter substrate-binding protein DctP [Burkholderiaceae bacterium]
MEKNSAKALALVAAMAIAGLGARAAIAQEVITLKVSDWMPLTHYTVSEGGKVFMAKAEELSRGRLKFEHYPAEQLGKAKDQLTLAQTGVADLANIAPAYITEKFPLSGVLELPGIYEGSCVGSYAYASMVRPGGVLHENEFKPNGVRVLFSGAIGAYRVLTANRKIEKASDFSGLKLRTAGGPMDRVASLLQANSIRLAGPDVLPSLTRGTLDGVFWPLQSVKPWGLEKALHHVTPNLSVGSFMIVYAISDRAWKKLPADLQEILVQAGDHATRTHCEYVDANEAKTARELEAGGIVPTPLPEADVKKIQAEYAKIHEDWATALDKRGKPGHDVLETFRKAVARN